MKGVEGGLMFPMVVVNFGRLIDQVEGSIAPLEVLLERAMEMGEGRTGGFRDNHV